MDKNMEEALEDVKRSVGVPPTWQHSQEKWDVTAMFLMLNREDSRTILGRAKARLRRLVGWRLWLSLPQWFHQEPLEALASRGDLFAQAQLAKKAANRTEHLDLNRVADLTCEAPNLKSPLSATLYKTPKYYI